MNGIVSIAFSHYFRALILPQLTHFIYFCTLSIGGTARAACYAIRELGKYFQILTYFNISHSSRTTRCYNTIALTICVLYNLSIGLNLVVTNRGPEKAQLLAQWFNGSAVLMSEVEVLLDPAQLKVCCV